MKPIFCILMVAGCMSMICSCSPHRQKADETPQNTKAVLLLATEQKNPYDIVFEAKRLDDTYIPKVGRIAGFKFIVIGASSDQQYILASQKLVGPISPLYEFAVDDDGLLGRQYEGSTMMLDNEVMLMFDFFRGEPVKYWLISKDGKTAISKTFVPYPIVAKGKDDALVSIRRLTPDARLVLCEGEGFLPDEELLISSLSSGQLIADVPLTCRNGKFSMTLEPGLSGKSGGIACVEVRRCNQRLVLEYDWGCVATDIKKRLANLADMEPDALLKLSLEEKS